MLTTSSAYRDAAPASGGEDVASAIARALETVAAIIAKRGQAGAALLPIFDRLDQEYEKRAGAMKRIDEIKRRFGA